MTQVQDLPIAEAREICKPYRIVLALPGLGKTTAVKAINAGFEDNPGKRVALDLDIRGPKGPSQPKALKDALSYYVRAAVNSNVVVFSFLHYFEWSGIPNVPVLVVVPKEEDVTSIVERIADRDKEAPLAREAARHYATWLRDWVREAESLREQGRKVTMVRIGSDEYVLDVLRRMKNDKQ